MWHGIGGGELVGQLCCAAAAVCYGFAIPYTRRVMAGRPDSGVSLAAAQLVVASVELAVVAPLLGGAPPAPWHLSRRRGRRACSASARSAPGSRSR